MSSQKTVAGECSIVESMNLKKKTRMLDHHSTVALSLFSEDILEKEMGMKTEHLSRAQLYLCCLSAHKNPCIKYIFVFIYFLTFYFILDYS